MKNLNDKRLFWASFLTLIAAGIGFSVRGVGLLGAWSEKFGFTMSELGAITGGGLVGFGITIIVLSFIADRIGYGPLMVLAFLLHVSSAVVTLAATPIHEAYHNHNATFWCLYIGMFLFALGNGTCEAVINPLTATLFPREKTHWLNILHAGWPGGLILGAILGLTFNQLSKYTPIPWEVQMATFLVPTLAYGALMFGCTFPRSEATASGVSLGTMLLEFVSPILLLLLVLHALVGYVELGTDSWISNITGRILENKNFGTMLFIWTSGLMFGLRFFAGPIVHKISPLGLLFVSAILGCIGLLMLGGSGLLMLNGTNTIICAIFCVFAATVYGFGKTFLWPTMLGVVSERFPKGGAMTLGAMGGIGMLSAGLLGGPGIGYKQDYFATQRLTAKEETKDTYRRYKSDEANSFLFLPEIAGLNGSKVATLEDEGKTLAKDMELLKQSGDTLTAEEREEFKKVADKFASNEPLTVADYQVWKKVSAKLSENQDLKMLNVWWRTEGQPNAATDKTPVSDAGMYGGAMALIVTAAVPATMALGYLLLILYFRMKGGYTAVHLNEEQSPILPETSEYSPIGDGHQEGIKGSPGVQPTSR